MDIDSAFDYYSSDLPDRLVNLEEFLYECYGQVIQDGAIVAGGPTLGEYERVFEDFNAREREKIAEIRAERGDIDQGAKYLIGLVRQKVGNLAKIAGLRLKSYEVSDPVRDNVAEQLAKFLIRENIAEANRNPKLVEMLTRHFIGLLLS